MSSEWMISEIKSVRLMAARRRKERCAAGGAGGDSRLREVKTGRWSEGESGEQQTFGLRDESEAVMMRSKVWLSSWVGKVTCCVRFMDDRSVKNCFVCEFDGSST